MSYVFTTQTVNTQIDRLHRKTNGTGNADTTRAELEKIIVRDTMSSNMASTARMQLISCVEGISTEELRLRMSQATYYGSTQKSVSKLPTLNESSSNHSLVISIGPIGTTGVSYAYLIDYAIGYYYDAVVLGGHLGQCKNISQFISRMHSSIPSLFDFTNTNEEVESSMISKLCMTFLLPSTISPELHEIILDYLTSYHESFILKTLSINIDITLTKSSDFINNIDFSPSGTALLNFLDKMLISRDSINFFADKNIGKIAHIDDSTLESLYIIKLLKNSENNKNTSIVYLYEVCAHFSALSSRNLYLVKLLMSSLISIDKILKRQSYFKWFIAHKEFCSEIALLYRNSAIANLIFVSSRLTVLTRVETDGVLKQITVFKRLLVLSSQILNRLSKLSKIKKDDEKCLFLSKSVKHADIIQKILNRMIELFNIQEGRSCQSTDDDNKFTHFIKPKVSVDIDDHRSKLNGICDMLNEIAKLSSVDGVVNVSEVCFIGDLGYLCVVCLNDLSHNNPRPQWSSIRKQTPHRILGKTTKSREKELLNIINNTILPECPDWDLICLSPEANIGYFKNDSCRELDKSYDALLRRLYEMSSKIVLDFIEEYITPNLSVFHEVCHNIQKFDAYYSISMASIEFEWKMFPIIKNGNLPFLHVEKLSHPALCLTFDQYKPISTFINLKNIQIISGPNFSGKSVFMNTLMTCVVLAQMGLPLPVDFMEFSIFNIFCLKQAVVFIDNHSFFEGECITLCKILNLLSSVYSIGSNTNCRLEQIGNTSIDNHIESSQMSGCCSEEEESNHIDNHNNIDQMTSFSEEEETNFPLAFIVIDEFGVGTNPCDGLCLYISLLNEFSKWSKYALSITSTHYGIEIEDMFENKELIDYLPTDKISKYCMKIIDNSNTDDLNSKIEFTHTIESVDKLCIYSYGFYIAKLSGILEAVYHRALSIYSGASVENGDIISSQLNSIIYKNILNGWQSQHSKADCIKFISILSKLFISPSSLILSYSTNSAGDYPVVLSDLCLDFLSFITQHSQTTMSAQMTPIKNSKYTTNYSIKEDPQFISFDQSVNLLRIKDFTMEDLLCSFNILKEGGISSKICVKFKKQPFINLSIFSDFLKSPKSCRKLPSLSFTGKRKKMSEASHRLLPPLTPVHEELPINEDNHPSGLDCLDNSDGIIENINSNSAEFNMGNIDSGQIDVDNLEITDNINSDDINIDRNDMDYIEKNFSDNSNMINTNNMTNNNIEDEFINESNPKGFVDIDQISCQSGEEHMSVYVDNANNTDNNILSQYISSAIQLSNPSEEHPPIVHKRISKVIRDFNSTPLSTPSFYEENCIFSEEDDYNDVMPNTGDITESALWGG